MQSGPGIAPPPAAARPAHPGAPTFAAPALGPPGLRPIRQRLADEFFGSAVGPTGRAERVLRPHPLAALGQLLGAVLAVAAIVATVLLVGSIGDGEPGRGAAWLYAQVQFLAGLLVPFASAVRLLLTRYIVDEEGLRVRTVLLSKTDQKVRWEKVTAVRHRRSLVDAALGLQRLDVIAYGARGATVRLVGLRSAPQLRRFAARQMRRHCSLASLGRLD